MKIQKLLGPSARTAPLFGRLALLLVAPIGAQALLYVGDASDRAAEPPMLALPGIVELWPILAILVLLFGARKLPELARAMGSSVTQFKRGLETPEDEAKAIDGEKSGDGPE